MFLLKKIVAHFLYPVPLCIEILLLGLIFLLLTRRQRTGKALVAAGVALLVILSYSQISDRIVRPLEAAYPPLAELAPLPDVRWVVVLGGGHTSDTKQPLTSQLSDASVVRLVEGIRIQRALPASKLVLSGGGVFDPVPEAEIRAQLALSIGVNEDDIILEPRPNDTKDEARYLLEVIGKDRFILVTSAVHMPRSIALFERLGMRPIPAPTDHRVKKIPEGRPDMFFPKSESLHNAKRAFHEYLGFAWARIRGQI